MRGRRGFAKVEPFDHGAPIWRPNMAAVTSILAATLILFIVHQIPPSHHAVTIDILNPSSGSTNDRWGRPTRNPANQPSHILGITSSGELLWDGKIVSDSELYRSLQSGLYRPLEPQIIFSPDADAPWDAALKALGTIKRTGITKFCFDPVNLEEHKDFATDWKHIAMQLSPILPPDTALPERMTAIDC